MHPLAAAYAKRDASDVCGLIGGQVRAGMADVFWGLRAALRDVIDDPLPALFPAHLVQDSGIRIVPHRSADNAGADRVDRDVLPRDFPGERLGERDNPGLG